MDSNNYVVELKVMYCKDVKAFNFFQKLLVYVIVSMVSDDPDKKLNQNQQQRTPADKQGDGNPEWNHGMRFDLAEALSLGLDHVYLKFDLRHQGLYFGDKSIGEVWVPIKDFIQDTAAAAGVTRFVSYQVRSMDGNPNGVVHFFYKVINCDGQSCSSQLQASGEDPVVLNDDHPSELVESSGSGSNPPKVHYPSLDLDLEGTSHSQELHCPPFPQVAPPDHYQSLGGGSGTDQYSAQGNYYPPPPPHPHAYHPLPDFHLHQRPPPPPAVAPMGAPFHQPHPHPPRLFHPCASGAYGYWNWGPPSTQ